MKQFFVMTPEYEVEGAVRVDGPMSSESLGERLNELVLSHGDALQFVARSLVDEDCDVDAEHYRVAIVRGEFVAPRGYEFTETP